MGKENHSTVWEHARLLLVVCQKAFKRQVCIGRYTVNGQGSRNDVQRSGAADSAVRVAPPLLDLLESGSGGSVLLRRLLGGVLSMGGAGLFIPATASLS